MGSIHLKRLMRRAIRISKHREFVMIINLGYQNISDSDLSVLIFFYCCFCFYCQKNKKEDQRKKSSLEIKKKTVHHYGVVDSVVVKVQALKF